MEVLIVLLKENYFSPQQMHPRRELNQYTQSTKLSDIFPDLLLTVSLGQVVAWSRALGVNQPCEGHCESIYGSPSLTHRW